MSRHVLDHLNDHLEGDLAPDEFARVDAHLSECGDCARALRELRETVALLRGLPSPAPPHDFTADLMQRIADDGSARGRVVPMFRRVAQPHIAAALAAGIAAAAFLSTLDIGGGGLLGLPSDPARNQIAFQSGSDDVPVPGTESDGRPRSPSPVPEASDVFAPHEHTMLADRRTDSPQRFGIFGSASPEIPMRDLEAEVDALMANPDAFLRRVERASATSRRPFVGPLVGYSAGRGGVAEVHRMVGGLAGPPMAVPASTGR